jgi:putative ABC transport system permease protein
MSFSSTALLARKSIRARLGRTIAIALMMTAGVSFVVGSFVLADSLRATFTGLFDELVSEVDLEVRATEAFDGDGSRDPIDATIADDLRGIDGIEIIEPSLTRFAQLLDQDGDIVATTGGPALGFSYIGEGGLQGVTLKDGRAPSGAGEVVVDKASADRVGYSVGDTVGYLTDTGTHSATLVGTIGAADSDGFLGASVVAVDIPTAIEKFGSGGKVDAIDIRLADGADAAVVQAAIENLIPARNEVVTGEVLSAEGQSDVDGFISVFGTGLLIFAFITTFIVAFIINNIFQITIGQRLRELALLRAVGASSKQVRRMIVAEAFVLGLIATGLGILGGIGVSRFIVWAFNQAGAGFPDTSTILEPRTFVAAAAVGIGVTMLSVFVPARRAATIPPVAAMRPELGFDALKKQQLIIGAAVTAVGTLLLVVGLFVQPGAAALWATVAGIGALALFLGVASVSSTIAPPVTRAIGWPIAKLFKVPGVLARDNVVRAPRRTSSSASALMIGVALVSASAVFASSLRATITDVLDNAITADYIVTDPNFFGLSPTVAEGLDTLEELDAVTPVRQASAQVDGETISIGAINPDAFDKLVDPDLQKGAIAGLGLNEVLIHTDPANDLDKQVGDTIDVLWQSGSAGTLTVAGVYGNATFGNWLISLDTLNAVSDAPARDLFIIAKLADGVTAAEGNAAVAAATAEFPQADVQTNAEFRKSQEDQINQLLLTITILLLMSIIIAVLGIAITLALGVFERTREIGLLRAVGMNRRQLRRSVRWEAVIVSSFGAMVGIVLGTFLGVIAALAVPDDIISKLAFNPVIIVVVMVFAVLAGLAASLYPSFKASNMDVLEAIATE